jgi:hypothetical protein
MSQGACSIDMRRIIQRQTAHVPRALQAFWTMVTFAYVLLTGYRALALGRLPGFSTAAGMAAVGAVWLEIADRVYATALTGLMAVTSLWLTLLGNGYVARATYVHTGNVPVTRTLLSLLFAFLLIRKFKELLAFMKNEKRNES